MEVNGYRPGPLRPMSTLHGRPRETMRLHKKRRRIRRSKRPTVIAVVHKKTNSPPQSLRTARGCQVSRYCATVQTDGEGFVTTADSQGNSQGAPEGEAKAEAVSPDLPLADADLARLVAVWSILPADVRGGILAMINANRAPHE